MQVPPPSDLTLGMVCCNKAVPGQTTWTMKVDRRFLNPAGLMQGGFISAFADSAMGASAVTFVRGRKVYCVNAEMKVSFIAPAREGDELVCNAFVVAGGQKVLFAEADVRKQDGSLVARATSTYLVFDRRADASD
jgi:uncharacterized protein (TIGR00369 family)